MSLDLFERESSERVMRFPSTRQPETGIWDGFVRGTGLSTMQGLAKIGRAVDVLGSIGPIVQDAFTGGTEAQDRYFQEHDEVWGGAVEFWTPNPREVGVAAQIAGQLLSTLPMVIASPGLAVGSTQLSIAEDLVKKGVDASTAQAVGASQAFGLGLGIYMPIFGQTLAQRILLGGAGFNVAQGIGMRSAGEMLLAGTPGEGEYKAFDPAALSLDLLLGIAFGSIVHLSPTQRAAGAEMWQRMESWAKGLKPSDIDALATLRQAQHLNADSMPGRPVEPVDIERHRARMVGALEQVLRDEPVNVSDLPAPRLEADEPKLAEMARRARELAGVAEEVRKAEGLPKAPRIEIPENPNLTPEQRVIEARARRQVENDLEGQLRAYERLPGTEDGKILNTDLARELFDDYRAARHNSAAVHEPASALVKELYARRVAEPDENGLNMITFSAGGTGAGKTSAMVAVQLASKIVQASQLVYDTNMANFRSAVEKVDLALGNGKQANVIFVGVDPVEAFKRTLKRAMKIGRTVPLDEHAKTHRGSAQAVQQLMERYQGDERVQFIFLDNGTGAKGEVSIVEPERAAAWLRTIDFDNLEPRLLEVLDAERKAGRISEEVYRGTAPALPEGAGAAARPGGSGEPRARGEGSEEGRAQLPREEVGPEAPPAPGEKFLVYRLGESGELTNRNAGNADAVARYIMGAEDPMSPVASKATKVFAYEVETERAFGKYEGLTRGRAAAGEDVGRVTRGKEVAYSFPEKGFKARLLGEVDLAKVRERLAKTGYQGFDEAGSLEGAKAIREAFTESEAPAASSPGGGTEPPPPRGSPAGEKAAGAEGPDPLELQATRIAQEHPDLQIKVGTATDGSPIVTTVKQYLDEVNAKAKSVAEDVKLYEMAAACLFGKT